MRAALLTGTLILVFAIPALAQAPSGHRGYQDNQGYDQDQDDRGPPGPMWRGRWHDEEDSWGHMHRRFHPEEMREMMRMRGALSGGTSFHVKHGDDEISIRCSPREQVQDCVNGATELMKALQQPASASTPSAGQKQ